jgi:hypothetical protein
MLPCPSCGRLVGSSARAPHVASPPFVRSLPVAHMCCGTVWAPPPVVCARPLSPPLSRLLRYQSMEMPEWVLWTWVLTGVVFVGSSAWWFLVGKHQYAGHSKQA